MTRALHWFRNDLRLRDNTALAEAAARADELAAVFVLDPVLLRSPRSGSARVRFLLACLEELGEALGARGVPLLLRRGDPAREVPRLLHELRAGLLCFNRDTTPYARRRDARVAARAQRQGVRVLECKDRVVFEAAEVLTGSGGAFSVYTPYARAWWRRFEQEPARPGRAPRLPPLRPRRRSDPLPTPGELGAAGGPARLAPGGEAAARRRLRRFVAGPLARYAADRDRPAVDGTSRLSPYLRFGAISVRTCFDAAREAAAREPALAGGAAKWMGELVWREFYAALLEANPRIAREAQRREYGALRWADDPHGLAAWREGRTGYPLVDAGMRQLAATGWMHNRVRMVAASFLVKDLWIDWREGEAHFLRALVDGDPASNNGGWQWCASTGSDAQPWFRILNPVAQGERFDPDGAYVRRWVPELARVPDALVQRPWQAASPPAGYPPPRVDHAESRARALAGFRAARRSGA